VKIRILITLVAAVVLFGLHLNSCSSCKKKEPNESKTSNSAGRDKTALDNAVDDKAAQEREWVNMTVEIFVKLADFFEEIANLTETTNVMNEAQLKSNGALVREKALAIKGLLRQLPPLINNSAVTVDKLNARLDSLLADGKVMSNTNTNNIRNWVKKFYDDETRKKFINDDINPYVLVLENAVAGWDKVVKEIEPDDNKHKENLKKALEAMLK
jgi:hypothetical protein